MKRYLIVFIDQDGQFCCETILANSFVDALPAFYNTGLSYSEIYSISRAS